jgi:chromatin structure-remodeling complex subunit RSC58
MGSSEQTTESPNRSEKKGFDDVVDQFFDDVYEILSSHSLGQELVKLDIVPMGDLKPSPEEFVVAPAANTKLVERTSIEKKFHTNKYNHDIYTLYHDFKLATVVTLVKLPVGSAKYTAVHDFFKFVADLMFREAVRLEMLDGAAAINGEHPEQRYRRAMNGVPTDVTFESEVFNGFRKIYSDINEWYGEGYYIMGQNGPLFSSLNGKASIDPRDTEVRAQFNTTKLLPQVASSTVYQLGFSSPVVSRVPHPSLPPTEMMSSFMHPRDAPLPSTRWLKFDGYSSFAPAQDNRATIITGASSAGVWYEKVGLKKLLEEDEEEEEEEESEDEDQVVEEDEQDKKMADESTTKGRDVKNEVNGVKSNEDVEMKDAPPLNDLSRTPQLPQQQQQDQLLPHQLLQHQELQNQQLPQQQAVQELTQEEVDVGNVLEWSPGSFVDDDELQAAKDNIELQLLSKLLLQLQNLQRVRLANRDGTDYVVTDTERRLALKVQNVLARVVSDYSPKELELSLSRLMPVLQVNYGGTLAGTDPKPIQQHAGGRLASISSRSTPVRGQRKR